MPYPSTGPEILCAGPNVLARPKIVLHLVLLQKLLCWQLAQKPNLLNVNHLLVWHKMFVTVHNM